MEHVGYRDALSMIIIQEFKDYIANVKKGFIDLIVSYFCLEKRDRQTDGQGRAVKGGERYFIH